MLDLQFIQFNDALPLSGVIEVVGMVPRTLEVSGPDMRSAIEVYINDQRSPSFIVTDSKTLLVQVPAGVEDTTITDISVLSSEFTATIRSQVRFRFSTEPKKCTGLRAMMQQFLRLLFTTPGNDAFYPSVGGAALKNIGRSVDLTMTSDITSDFAISVSRVATQMVALQSQQTRLTGDERLLAANLLNVRFDPNTTALIARVELISESGLRAITNLEL
jgi:hypothetical protein